MNTNAPFTARPCKPQVTRLPDGRFGVFMGAAYQFTDADGIRSLRDQIDELLPAPTAREVYETADRVFCRHLSAELDAVDAGSSAPAVIATRKAGA